MTFQNPYWNSYGGVPPGSSWGHFWRTSKFRKTHFSEKGPKFEIKLQISRLQYDLAPKLGLSGVRGPSKFQKISEKNLKKLSEKQNRKKTLVIFGQGPKRALRRVSSSKKSALENPGACVFTTSHYTSVPPTLRISIFHCFWCFSNFCLTTDIILKHIGIWVPEVDRAQSGPVLHPIL